MQKRHYLKIFVLAVLCSCLLLIGNWLPVRGNAPTASAHAFVVGSDPIDGSTISVPPAVVRIYFDAPIAASSQATVTAFSPGSTNGLLVSTNRGTINPHNGQELDIELLPAGKLPLGGYEVNWTALSLTDGHTTSGLIGFNLGYSNTGVAGTPTLGPSTSNHVPQISLQGVLSMAWDWLVTLALLFWAGILISEAFILPRAVSTSLLGQTRKRSRSLLTLCLAGLLVGEIILLILRATTFTQTLGQSSFNPDIVASLLLGTNYGHLWLVRIVLLLGALLVYWWSNERQKRSPSAAPSGAKTNKRLRQLRQQVREENLAEVTNPSASAISTLSRSQPRVSGAITAHSPTTRATTSSHPRITVQSTPEDAPIHPPALWQSVSWLVLVGLIMLTQVLSNELLQLAPLPISAGLFSWLALVAQAIWFGGIAYLGFILLPLLPTTNPDQHAETLLRLLKRARPFLLAAIGILLACEVFLNETALLTPAQFLDDPYGRSLLVQDALLILMLGLTGFAFFALVPRLQRQTVLLPVVTAEMPARRTRTVELTKTEHTIKRVLYTLSGLAATILVCAAFMNFFAPPVVFPNVNYALLIQQANTAATPATSQTQTIGKLSATLDVSPARVGASNTVTLILNDSQDATLSRASVKLTINMQIMDMGTTSATLASNGGTTYTTTFSANQTFTMAGAWLVQIEIDRPAQSAQHLTFVVTATG